MVGDDVTGSAIVDPDEIRKAIRRDTKFIAITHASNVTGTVQPIRAIGRIAREHGISFIVDAAQSAGHLPIDVQDDCIDLLAAPGHKALLGPLGTGFLYVRPGTEVGRDAKIGTFVEVKKARIGARAKVPHLSYIGDAEIGEATNVAAGNITANFPHEQGKPKGTTRIGRNVRTGVDNTFVAPVEIGDDAWIAPGAVITDDVPPGSLAGFAPRQETKEGWVHDKHGKRDDG